MIPQSPQTSSFLKPLSPHLHIDGEACPWCEQEIPAEKLEEISGKIAAREREQTKAITAQLEQQHAFDKAQLEAKVKADVDAERRQSAAREAAAREETLKAAEAAAAEKLAAAEQSRQELQAALQKQVEESESARRAAEQAGIDLKAQLQQLRQDNETALATAKADAEAREAEIRTQAQLAAEAAVAEKLAASESARLESEAALQARIAQAEETKLAAEQKGAALQLQLDELHKANEAEVAKVREDAAAEASRIRQEATEIAEAFIRQKIADNERTLAEALEKTAEAENKLSKLSEQHELALKERLDSQREILEKAKDEAINAEKAKAFDENQKLSNKVNELQRALEKKTNEELGEGAEIDLYEALKKEFPDDRIERIAKGAPGADIIHVVLHNGRECGTIIYNSKNHNAFRNDHVTKLLNDQLAAKAEHAILSTHKFPAGTRQLHIQDGVLLANPARVVSVVTLIRQHLLQTHTLRLSSTERESKTAALYAFITSERCTQLFGRVDAHTEELLEQQVKEKKQHEAAWKKEGELIRSIQRVRVELSNEISGIIGTAVDHEVTLEALEL